MAIDPVCGMQVEESPSAEQFEHEGTIYYFCCKGCRMDFADDPSKFLKGGSESETGHGTQQ